MSSGKMQDWVKIIISESFRTGKERMPRHCFLTVIIILFFRPANRKSLSVHLTRYIITHYMRIYIFIDEIRYDMYSVEVFLRIDIVWFFKF